MSKSTHEDWLVVQLRARKIPAPTQEFIFHPTRKWRLDLAWPDIKVGVEIHGGTYGILNKKTGKRVAGRHTQGDGFTEDRRKMNHALLEGWMVFEFTTQQVDSGEALAFLEEFFKKQGDDLCKEKKS